METVTEKPSFRKAASARRGLLVGDGYYAWEKKPGGGKIPTYLHDPEDQILAFAALFENCPGCPPAQISALPAVLAAHAGLGVLAVVVGESSTPGPEELPASNRISDAEATRADGSSTGEDAAEPSRPDN